jgi:hypothetical protein
VQHVACDAIDACMSSMHKEFVSPGANWTIHCVRATYAINEKRAATNSVRHLIWYLRVDCNIFGRCMEPLLRLYWQNCNHQDEDRTIQLSVLVPSKRAF